MQPVNKTVRRGVFRDCLKAMFTPLVLLSASNLLARLLSVLTASVFGDFADAVFAMDRSIGLRSVLILAVCILATVVLAPAVSMLGNFSMLRNALRHDNVIFGRFLRQDMQKALEGDLGELQYQLEDAPNDLRIYWINIMSQALALPIGWAYLLWRAGSISWLLTGVMIAVSLLKLAVSAFFQKRIARDDAAEKAYHAARRACETDVTRKPWLVRLWGLKLPLLGRINALFDEYYRKTAVPSLKTKVVTEQTPRFIDTLAALILFGAGALCVSHGAISPGNLAAMIAFLPVTQALLANLSEIVENYPRMMNAANRVGAFCCAEEKDSGRDVGRFESIIGRNVCFRYGETLALRDASFSIRRGDKVRLAGENGSGKSTLVKILCGLLRDYDGEILLNGVDLKDVNLLRWRRRIAYAPQNPYLFEASVRENIVLGNDSLPRERVDELMRGFSIQHLADKPISMNAELSGGEKQKISILRALLRDSDVLILDEPTNHLDAQSVDFLRQCLANDGRTVLVIAHSTALDGVLSRTIRVGG